MVLLTGLLLLGPKVKVLLSRKLLGFIHSILFGVDRVLFITKPSLWEMILQVRAFHMESVPHTKITIKKNKKQSKNPDDFTSLYILYSTSDR